MTKTEKDVFLRKALRTTAVFNVVAAAMVAFPSSLGQAVGLPLPVPRLYTTLLCSFVVLFGGVYAWLARSPEIDRPLVVLGAVGKISVFAIVAAFWFAGNAPGMLVLLASGDLAFATIFLWWLSD
jgi:hypothetical protein